MGQPKNFTYETCQKIQNGVRYPHCAYHYLQDMGVFLQGNVFVGTKKFAPRLTLNVPVGRVQIKTYVPYAVNVRYVRIFVS